ncbi:MAG: hypothetical protein ACFHU9_15615 [Fluviicola sp.]
MKQLHLIASFILMLFVGNAAAQSRDTLELTPFSSSDTVHVGQIITYTGNIHGSVGEELEVYSSDEDIVQFIDSDIQYKKKQVPGMTGGDAAWKTFLFKAEKAGNTEMTIQEIFRGEVIQETRVVIMVVE